MKTAFQRVSERAMAVTARVNPLLIRLAMLALVIGTIAFAIAMCAPSNDASHGTGKPEVSAIPPSRPPNAATPAPAPAPPPAGKDYVEGMVESVSGGSIALRTRSGSATVDFAPATPVFRVSPAQLTDVTPGSCVNVRATPQGDPGAGFTAQAVTITAAIDDKCPPPAGFYGTVASVSGNTIAVNGIGGQPAPTTVTVTDTTSYKRQTVSNAQAITNGTCMGAQGTDDGGALRATTISLEQCPPMGPPRHRFHLPHLPHLHL